MVRCTKDFIDLCNFCPSVINRGVSVNHTSLPHKPPLNFNKAPRFNSRKLNKQQKNINPIHVKN